MLRDLLNERAGVMLSSGIAVRRDQFLSNGATGNSIGAPGGAGPGFTKSVDVPPGVPPPETIGPNRIESSGSSPMP